MGVTEAMIRAIKDNRSVRGKQKTMRDRSADYSYDESSPLAFEDSMSEFEHTQHKTMWQKRKRRSQIKLAVFFGAIVIIIAAWIVWLGM